MWMKGEVDVGVGRDVCGWELRGSGWVEGEVGRGGVVGWGEEGGVGGGGEEVGGS